MKTLVKLMLASAIGFFCVQPLSAQPTMAMSHGHEGMGHMGFMHGESSPFMMLLKSANLTQAQRAQVREILEADRARMKPVSQQFHALHEQIAARLLSAGPVTPADLAPLTQKAFRLQQQIDQNMVDTALAIRNLLTPDQLTQLSQVHQQLQNLHEQIHNLLGSDPEDRSESDDMGDRSN